MRRINGYEMILQCGFSLYRDCSLDGFLFQGEKTPLHLAAESRHTEEIASLLVAFEADLEAKEKVIDMKPMGLM